MHVIRPFRASPPRNLKPSYRKCDVTYRIFKPHPGVYSSR